MVGARTDSADHFFGFRGRENELHMFRRLFNDLEQRIEALWRDHVRLIEDENFVAVPSRRENGALSNVAGVVNSVVAGRVNLHDVEGATAVTS